MPNYITQLQTHNSDLQTVLQTLQTKASGVKLPDLTNPATASELLSGKELIDQEGKILTGSMPNNGSIALTMDGIDTKTVSIPGGYTSGGTVSLDNTIDEEVGEQSDLIAQIKNAANNLPEAGSGDNESTGVCSSLTVSAVEEILVTALIYSTNGTYYNDFSYDSLRIVNDVDINTIILLEALDNVGLGFEMIAETENVELIHGADYLWLFKCTSTEPASIHFKFNN